MNSIRCSKCEHYIEANAGEGKIYGCDRSKCVFEPTTKNDSIHSLHTDEEIEKSFIEDVEAVKDQLPCGELMDFPSTFDDFARDYGFKDKNEIYTNGSELIPVFRVKQWLEHISTTKNDLGVDAVSRKAVITIIQNHWWNCRDIDKLVNELPSVTPQEPRWIPVSERLPKELHGVLVYCPTNNNVFCAYLEKGVWKIFSPEALEEVKEIVTAWMPIPEPYKVIEE